MPPAPSPPPFYPSFFQLIQQFLHVCLFFFRLTISVYSLLSSESGIEIARAVGVLILLIFFSSLSMFFSSMSFFPLHSPSVLCLFCSLSYPCAFPHFIYTPAKTQISWECRRRFQEVSSAFSSRLSPLTCCSDSPSCVYRDYCSLL